MRSRFPKGSPLLSQVNLPWGRSCACATLPLAPASDPTAAARAVQPPPRIIASRVRGDQDRREATVGSGDGERGRMVGSVQVISDTDHRFQNPTAIPIGIRHPHPAWIEYRESLSSADGSPPMSRIAAAVNNRASAITRYSNSVIPDPWPSRLLRDVQYDARWSGTCTRSGRRGDSPYGSMRSLAEILPSSPRSSKLVHDRHRQVAPVGIDPCVVHRSPPGSGKRLRAHTPLPRMAFRDSEGGGLSFGQLSDVDADHHGDFGSMLRTTSPSLLRYPTSTRLLQRPTRGRSIRDQGSDKNPSVLGATGQ